MADPARPLTLADLWLRGDVLDGALLRGWNGPVFWCMHTDGDSADTLPSFERIDGIHVQELEPDEAGGRHLSFIPHEWFGRHVSFPPCLDCDIPEVRDRAVRVLGPDLLPVHVAEIRGEITPGEAAGLVWASVLRKAAGLPAVGGWAPCLSFINTRGSAGSLLGRSYDWLKDDGDGLFPARSEAVARCLTADENDPLPLDRYGWRWGQEHGPELGDAGLAKIHAAALAAGYALREPDGVLLLPLPDGVVGRLDTSR